MDSPTLIALVLAGLALAIALAVLLRPRRDDGGAALTARLEQLAVQQSAAQSALGEQLQRQERALTDAMAARMETLDAKLNAGLVNTTKETQSALGEVRKQLAVIDAAQKNIADLSSQVVSLQGILSNKQARGAFGEVQLRDLVEAVLPPDAYAFQASVGDNKRVDCLIRMPNPPGSVPVDSKFPLEAYNALQAAEGEAQRQAAGRAFAQSVRTHIKDIASKYIVPGETCEYALMFLPSEAIYAELHARHAEVVADCQRARVLPVSPTTLWAMLTTMRAVLQDVRMREQAGVIQREVGKLVEDVGRLDQRTGQLQRHFDQAVQDVREIRVSTEKIVGRGERIASVELEDPAATLPASSEKAR
jgi:DNA recombination protein RmuC